MTKTAAPASAVVLLSGGLDSATLLAMATRNDEPRIVHALTFDYGQRHRHEIASAGLIAHALGAASHVVVPMDLRWIGGSALTADIEVPKCDPASPKISDGPTTIPVTYVPARNLIFLSLALGYAESRGASELWIGVNAVDYSGYPDCRPEFLASFQQTADLATRAGVQDAAPIRVVAPLIGLSKAQIIRTGVSLGVNYAHTHSCYDPVDGLACGRCESCRLRAEGFKAAGIHDPTQYCKTQSRPAS